MTYRSYFGNQNSTLGSVVPLAMFKCTIVAFLNTGIPCTLLTDSMAGALLASGVISSVVAGCDRFS